MKRIVNALSFDVEDYFQVAAFDRVINRESWNTLKRRVDSNTKIILSLLDDFQIRATFYTLGWVAQREPGLIKAIAAAGHEVACHGFSHRLIYSQSRREFAEETHSARVVLEDLVQKPVTSYRAASYSVTEHSLWALDVLYEEGFRTDSSIFPIRHDRYGLQGGPLTPYTVALKDGGRLLEFPISTVRMAGLAIPVSGGGYFRLYPYALSRYLISRVNAEGRPAMFYLHPWELDPDQPRIDVGLVTRFRHYNNLEKCQERLVRLLRDFEFTTVADCIAANYDENELPVHSYS